MFIHYLYTMIIMTHRVHISQLMGKTEKKGYKRQEVQIMVF